MAATYVSHNWNFISALTKFIGVTAKNPMSFYIRWWLTDGDS